MVSVASFVAFSFSGAPLFMNIIIEDYGYSGSMILMAIIFGFGMAFIGWLFFRDKPEDCGLLMDGDKITSLDTTNLFPEPETTLKEALRTYNFWIFCLGLCSAAVIVTGLTFHISSIGALAGLSRMEAYGLFLPMSVISVISHFFAGWASDRMPLKYLLMILLAGLAVGQSWNTKFGIVLVQTHVNYWFWSAGRNLGLPDHRCLAAILWTQAPWGNQWSIYGGSSFRQCDWAAYIWFVGKLKW